MNLGHFEILAQSGNSAKPASNTRHRSSPNLRKSVAVTSSVDATNIYENLENSTKVVSGEGKAAENAKMYDFSDVGDLTRAKRLHPTASCGTIPSRHSLKFPRDPEIEVALGSKELFQSTQRPTIK
jgi:hypothetical protein